MLFLRSGYSTGDPGPGVASLSRSEVLPYHGREEPFPFVENALWTSRQLIMWKILVRKKSDTKTRIDARTTVLVVARPTPSAPPRAFRPL